MYTHTVRAGLCLGLRESDVEASVPGQYEGRVYEGRVYEGRRTVPAAPYRTRPGAQRSSSQSGTGGEFSPCSSPCSSCLHFYVSLSHIVTQRLMSLFDSFRQHFITPRLVS